MSERSRLRKESIRSRYLFTVFVVFITLIITSFLFYLFIDHAQNKLEKERAQIEDRYQLVEEMSSTLNNIIFHVRGYIAFDSERERVKLIRSLDEFDKQIKEFNTYDLDESEIEFVESQNDFYNEYRYEIYPDVEKAVRTGDSQSLKDAHNSRVGTLVSTVLNKTENYKKGYETRVENINRKILEKSQQYSILSSALAALFLLLLLPLVGTIINRIIRPIEELQAATDQVSNGQFVQLPKRESDDEIGKLIQSFRKMAQTIQAKEEDLVTHNEELIAQQDELEEQQEKVQRTMLELKETNEILERLNVLNNHLTFTLNKQELCDTFHTFLNQQFIFDQSLFWLVNEKIYASNGVSKETRERLLHSEGHMDLLRLKEERIVVIKRQTTAEEQGIAEMTFDAYDLYASIFDADQNIVAIFAATRLGTPFHDEEIAELNGLMQRMALATERIYMYEDVEVARQLNHDIVEHINEGIQFVDMDGNMLQYNDTLKAYVRAENWKHEEHVPYAVWTAAFAGNCTPDEQLQTYFKAAVAEEEMEDKIFEYRIGEERFMSVYAAPVYRSGKRFGTILVHRDITRAHEIDQMKSELVSTVSHELRTPLSSVLGFTELLLTKDLKEERRKKYLQTIHKEAKRLTNLINDFLDIQRMETGRQEYHTESCRMDEIAMDVVSRFGHEKKHNIYLVDEAPDIRIAADRQRLEQVLTNLIGNAVKFMPGGGNIEIKLCNRDGKLVTSIHDEGLGIPKEHIGKLFTKFQRIDNSERRKIGGTGLGLAISKEIIDHHNGDIWIDSEEGTGTTVSFSLPLADAQMEAAAAKEQDRQTGCNVMIVEDDTSIALLLSEELKGKGFTVIHHYHPEHAYKEALTLPLVGIVVDLMLGEDINGWELIKMLKETKETKDIPIIISSALDQEKSKMKTFEIKKYFTKPYNPEELTKVLNTFLHPDQTSGDVLFPKKPI